MFDHPATPVLSADVRRQIGQQLATFYDHLTLLPPSPELLALIRRIERGDVLRSPRPITDAAASEDQPRVAGHHTAVVGSAHASAEISGNRVRQPRPREISR